MKPFFAILLLSALIGIFNFFLNPNRPLGDEYQVSIEQLNVLNEKLLFVDARSPEEFSQCHISGAMNLSEGDFNSQIGALIEAWSPDVKVVVYCNPNACDSANQIAKRLRKEFGLQNIYTLKGDWTQWKN